MTETMTIVIIFGAIFLMMCIGVFIVFKIMMNVYEEILDEADRAETIGRELSKAIDETVENLEIIQEKIKTASHGDGVTAEQENRFMVEYGALETSKRILLGKVDEAFKNS